MEFFQWLRQVVFRLYHRFIPSSPTSYDNESTMAGSSSDSPVHQLWPLSEGNQRTKLDVVLFHGLQLTANESTDAWSSTWTQRGHDDVCWPQKWLPFDLAEAVRIFSVSYNADVVTCPHGHVSEIAHNLLQNLMSPRYEWHHPIVLIGHSFGGLVLKSLVVKLKRASTNSNLTDLWSKVQQQSATVFLSNVRGVAFYAVPHAGASNIPKYVKELLKCNSRHKPGIVGNIQPRQKDMEQLSVDFDRIVTEKEISIYAFCEGRPMEQVGILVDETSARRSAADNFYKIEDADHMEVCKPPSKEHPSYEQLLQFIITCQKVARECDQPLQEVHDLPESTFGLESYVERVETLVTAEASDAAPRYVGVWGMGGVGKTLLLQTLYANAQVHDHFEGVKFIWRTVGKTPDIMALYQSLSEELGLKPKLNLNEEDYKLKLYSQFRQRRVFLVFDDVWEDETFDSLDLAKGKGSVTLLSTRDLSILERSEPEISRVNITRLSKEDSWSLFCVHAFKPPSNVPCEVEACAQSMAEECQGLPLALKFIGKAMSGKRSLKLEWLPLLKKLRRSCLQEKTVKKKLYERLKLGYDVLSEDDWRLNACFHYFAAFPEKSQIFFEEILFHWVGEGLVPTDDEDDPTADALSLLKKLLDRSLIESNAQSGADIYNVMKFKYSLYFKLHDVMRDLAFYILEKDCGTPPAKQLYFYRASRNLGEIPKDLKLLLEARRLSLDTNNLQKLPDSFRAPKLMFLLLGRNAITSLPSNFSSNFPMLTVLNLSNGEFDSLPAELGNLYNLVFLDLSDCKYLQILPDTIRNLHELQFLILDDCWSLKYLPSEMTYLTSLQVLHTAACKQLSWAEYTLSRTSVEFYQLSSTVGASLEDICGLNRLTELTIFGDSHPALEIFELPQNELPRNISALTNLQLLQVCLSIKSLPAELAYGCSQLQELEIYSPILTCLPTSFTRRGSFPALIKLKVYSYELVEFPEVERGGLPKLEKLDLTDCPSLTTLPLSLQFLTNLEIVIVVDKLQNLCSKNREISSIWKTWNIQFSKIHPMFELWKTERAPIAALDPLDIENSRKYTFGTHHSWNVASMTNRMRKEREYLEKIMDDAEGENTCRK